MDTPETHEDTPSWIFFVHISFILSITLMCVGIYDLPVNFWIKGYLVMGLFFSTASSISLCKTVRDNHESKKLINRVKQVRTEKMLQEYELKP
jgi:hypothetical protein